MSYEKQTWASGDVITAEKLNHMEDGIADGMNVVTIELGNPGSAPTVESVSIPPAEVIQGVMSGKPYMAYVYVSGLGKVGANVAVLYDTTLQINTIVSLVTDSLGNIMLKWDEDNGWIITQMEISVQV